MAMPSKLIVTGYMHFVEQYYGVLRSLDGMR